MSGRTVLAWLPVLVVSLVAGAPASVTPAEADAFLCYKTRPTEGSAGLPAGTRATVTDAFESALYELKPAAALCTPASVAGAPVADDLTHLAGYPVKVAATQPPQPSHVRRTNVL